MGSRALVALLLLCAGCPIKPVVPDAGRDGGIDAAATDAEAGGDDLAAPGDGAAALGGFRFGVEYAEPGLAAKYAAAGVRAAKTRLEIFTWDRSEPRPPSGGVHAYEWSCTDQAIREYQGAGFTFLQSYLSPSSSWASKNLAAKDIMPKPERLADYEAWVGALFERYDGDGKNDMPGLTAPLLDWVVAGEWSGFWGSGSADDYLRLLEITRGAARAAEPRIKLGLIPLLLTDVFEGNPPSPTQIAARLRDPPPWFRNSTAGLMRLLDRGDLYDYVDLHSLGAYTEIGPTLAWLRGELARRGLRKPIWIDDAFPISILANGTPNAKAMYPVTQGQLATVYELLLRIADPAHPGHGPASRWLQTLVAVGAVQKVVVAAAEGAAGIQLGNTEDWAPDQQVDGLGGRKQLAYLIGAAAFMGLVEVTHPGGYEPCKVRQPGAARPAWRNLELLGAKLQGADTVERLAGLGPGIWAFRFRRGGSTVTVAWGEDDTLQLPGESEAAIEARLPVGNVAQARLTWAVTDPAAPPPKVELRPVSAGRVTVGLTSVPVFVEPQ